MNEQRMREQSAVVRSLRVLADSLANEINIALLDAIRHWDDVEPVPCGHTGGWSLNSEGDEGPVDEHGMVRLRHECFYAHSYDLHDSYDTSVELGTLLYKR